jgi:hypothetical protein
MNLLGKHPDEVKEDFCIKYNIPRKEFDDVCKFLKFGNVNKKILIVVVGVTSIIIGAAFILSMGVSAANGQFVPIFKTVTNFYQRFINIVVILIEIGIGTSFITIPFVVWNKVFNWKWD